MTVAQPLPAFALARSAAPRVETIILATDLSAASAAATEQAIELASRLEARLLVVHVVGSTRQIGGFGRSSRPETREERARSAQAVVFEARATGVDATFILWEGEPGSGILSVAESESADLIIVGSHGRGTVGRYFLGSVSDYIVHHASCPVLVVRPHEDADEAGAKGPGVAGAD